ncbi:hypothetical protein PHYBLDRAFT_200797 [Phycomyces blakesleeanus NRRL 1555(-)]|uniref:MULE transposase domain-containing protein n=1 Tax=Phycomyces blakesleeanus (strain ATCC 8743b / DSM 1359 / FGSC 10004 / NBRC 33097 / NRRL 1555) TaxID=763407 RepID=A0A163D9G5_PHYB8|nr:hypothetical protein PHYBLDRAFT_200797 [Phycomyces blakesleeanus NRRL 1555(-)]OAD69740.1 hypothetical protein PHYBLDRAFT_200797 [Phycomyces blakesleeanus NRRL 1555(-)]|eukprot:XP_018287780.1 hypothetical protein PHYBLDRAFT_200797 [Phycomyces blakesleeanus NRRL 1555(-)]
MSNIDNTDSTDNTNDLVIFSKAFPTKYDYALTEFNSIFLIGREFSSTEAVREAAKAYGTKHNIALTTTFSSTSRIKMSCKHAGEYRDTRKAKKAALNVSVGEDSPLPGWKRQREKDTQKRGCPCFVYASRKKTGIITVNSREAQHNHGIEDDRRAYAMYRKLSPEAMSLVTKHLEDQDDVSTIFEDLKDNGFKNIIRQDIENIKQDFRKSDVGKEMSGFITILQELNFHVRHSVSSSEHNKDNMVFFAHKDAVEKARRMAGTVVIDATYKTDIHKMAFVNIVGTDSTEGKFRMPLKTFPIAGAWVESETEENYLWVIRCLRDAVWPDVDDSTNTNINTTNNATSTLTPILPSMIVTENEGHLRNAASFIFPESKSLVCYKHIKTTFKKQLFPVMKGDEDGEKIILLEKLTGYLDRIFLECTTPKETKIETANLLNFAKENCNDHGKLAADFLERYI